MIICIDFDGTIVKHEFPEIGDPVPNALECMRKIIDNDHRIILYTMRSGQYLKDAVNYLEEHKIYLFGVNNNREQSMWTSSPKIYAHLYIDDAALGCPLVYGEHKRPYVDWFKVEDYLIKNNIIKE
jgi:hydroxymethylpyrimidine pyrophosphatase-like HAD family hydrolase